MNNNKKVAAFFDFDGTLIYLDAIVPFLLELVGFWKLVIATLHAFFKGSYYKLSGKLGDLDPRTVGKELMLRKLLAGVPVSQTHQAALTMSKWVFCKKRLIKALLDHQAKGHKIIIATGSLEIYMPQLLAAKGIKYDALLATQMEENSGVLTGRFATTGNRVRQIKAAVVKDWLKENGPFDETWGYGNAPNDLPMLELLQHKTIV